MSDPILPLGKLPADMMARLLSAVPGLDEAVVIGPGPGLDCAVLDVGERLLVLKSDPITFTAADLGWYLVQINANDIATSGAKPRWLMMTLLLPESRTTGSLVQSIFDQTLEACAQHDIVLIGGHTEVTEGIDRPIAVGTLIGEVAHQNLVTSRGARPGDKLMLTKFVPIEATAILCQEFPDRLVGAIGPAAVAQGARYHLDPGISVLRDAQIACAAGTVTAMHDPTEGGLAAAIWELSDACGHRIVVDTDAVPISKLARRVCDAFQLDPLAAISSGALLLTAPDADHQAIISALNAEGISCTVVGHVEPGPPGVWRRSAAGRQTLARPDRDELARCFDRAQRPR